MIQPSQLIVTTSKSLLALDPVDGTIRVLDSGREHYYGVTKSLDTYYVGIRHRSNASPIPKDQERGRILVFDQAFRFREEIGPDFPLRDIHQITMHAGMLWVTCSYDNMVAVFDGVRWRQWYPLGEPDSEYRDRNHFNSISAFANQLCVVAHNLGSDATKPSELLFYNLPELKLVRRVALGFQSHNAWLHGDELMTCSSGEGRLRGINGTEVLTGGFPRSAAYANDEIYIGLSEFSARKDRDESKGEIVVFGPKWEKRRTLSLSGHGMITDMLAITAGDIA
jgi:hypothetical protein